MMQRSLRLVVVLVAALLTTSCGDEDGPAVRFLSIGTGGTGGIYYPLGGAIASMMSADDPSRQYTAEVTGGSVENIARLANGEIDMGFAMSNSARAAFDGSSDGDAVTGLRIVAPLYPNLAHVLVRDGGGIDSVADFAGKAISVGSAGSGTEEFARHLLGAYDLDYEAIDERYLSFAESSSALRDGAIDAAIFSVGYPAAAVLEATINATVTLIPVAPEDAERLRATYPFYTMATIPAGTYRGVDTDVPTVGVMNWVVGMEGLDDESAIAFLDILRERLQVLVRVNGVATQIDLTTLNDAPIPLHPATARWLEENR